jgi:hypothetical protein
MIRAVNLFAAASATLLILGLILSNFFETRELMSVSWPRSHAGYIIGCHVPCYGLAGLFAVFAFLHALKWIRVSGTIVDWHLWLTLLGVAIFGIGFALFAQVSAASPVHKPSQVALLTVAAGLIVGPAIFVVGQLLLVIAFIRGFAAQHQ